MSSYNIKKSVLMSIKPEFAEKIFKGEKKYEFRRMIFKNKEIDRVVVYASFPVMRVIGEFLIGDILEMDLDKLWKKTNKEAGISKELFMAYYRGKNKGYAIRISTVKRYEKPLVLQDVSVIRPPQSFQYL